MRRGIATAPEPNGRTASRRSAGEMKQEQANYALDAKREGAMCAYGCCQSNHDLQQAPDGYSGQYGGTHLCPEHYKKVVDFIRDNGCLPSEKPDDGPATMENFFDG